MQEQAAGRKVQVSERHMVLVADHKEQQVLGRHRDPLADRKEKQSVAEAVAERISVVGLARCSFSLAG